MVSAEMLGFTSFCPTYALMADATENGATAQVDVALDGQMQALLTEAKNTLGLSEGECTMFIADVPSSPPSMPAIVMVAQSNASQQTATKREHVLGVCKLVNLMELAQVDLAPLVYVNNYYFNDRKIDSATANVTVIQQPKHGHVEIYSAHGWTGSFYRPNDGYLGNDSFVMQVEGNGFKVRLQYFVAVAVDDTATAFNLNPACKGGYWKISINPDDPNSPIYTFEQTSQLTSAYAGLSNVDLAFADLKGGTVGQARRLG